MDKKQEAFRFDGVRLCIINSDLKIISEFGNEMTQSYRLEITAMEDLEADRIFGGSDNVVRP